MNVAVLVKQVPDTTEIKMDPKTGTLIREGVESIINPDDRLGLETALALKDQLDARVIALSMGPPQAIDAISEAMAMGADRGVLLSDRFFAGADTWATSFTLGKALEKLGQDEPLDLVICGRQAIDGDTAQIGPQIAEHLGWPQITYVREIKIKDGQIQAWRQLPQGVEEVTCPLPALITVLASPTHPRWPRVDLLLDACLDKAPIESWNGADLGCPAKNTGLRGSLTQVAKTFSPKTERITEWVEGKPAEQALTLLSALQEKNLI
jgi:electron transfer flavoprotein beta subunit